jgi:hypothetical protein
MKKGIANSINQPGRLEIADIEKENSFNDLNSPTAVSTKTKKNIEECVDISSKSRR